MRDAVGRDLAQAGIDHFSKLLPTQRAAPPVLLNGSGGNTQAEGEPALLEQGVRLGITIRLAVVDGDHYCMTRQEQLAIEEIEQLAQPNHLDAMRREPVELLLEDSSFHAGSQLARPNAVVKQHARHRMFTMDHRRLEWARYRLFDLRLPVRRCTRVVALCVIALERARQRSWGRAARAGDRMLGVASVGDELRRWCAGDHQHQKPSRRKAHRAEYRGTRRNACSSSAGFFTGV